MAAARARDRAGHSGTFLSGEALRPAVGLRGRLVRVRPDEHAHALLPGPCRIGGEAHEIARLKAALGLAHVLVSGPAESAVEPAAAGAGLFVAGELRHHDALAAARAGVTVVCTLHSNSERAALRGLSARLAERLPGLEPSVSARDADPFTFA